MIVEDTRQQAGKHDHIARWMEAHGVEFAQRASALPFGDYVREGSNVSIDTKKDVQELAMDVGRDHARFVREAERAAEAGYRLVVLIEQHPEYNDRSRLYTWMCFACRRCRKCNPFKQGRCTRYRSKPMNGPTVAKIIARLETDHGMRFEFCDKRRTAPRICEILGEPYK